MKVSELSPRSLLLWVEWRSHAKRSAEADEIRRRQGRRQRIEDQKRGEFKTGDIPTAPLPRQKEVSGVFFSSRVLFCLFCLFCRLCCALPCPALPARR